MTSALPAEVLEPVARRDENEGPSVRQSAPQPILARPARYRSLGAGFRVVLPEHLAERIAPWEELCPQGGIGVAKLSDHQRLHELLTVFRGVGKEAVALSLPDKQARQQVETGDCLEGVFGRQ